MPDSVDVDLEFARELLARESAPLNTAHGRPERRRAMAPAQAVVSGERVLQQLQDRMIRWFGPDGVDALLLRSLDRTRVLHPVMSLVRHEAAGSLSLAGMVEGVNEFPPGDASSQDQVTDGIVALIATILALVGRLVGDDMTRHLVGQIWPQTSSEESLSNEGSNGAKVDK